MDVTDWIERYLAAWTHGDPAEAADLFTPDARYRTEPWSPWLEGRDAIARMWGHRIDPPGTWTFEYTVLAQGGSQGPSFVEGVTRYRDFPDYSNLWVIRLADDGRAREFTEWAIDQSLPVYDPESGETR
jgi:limonene-1,2-epoxide hydrolase